MTDLGVVHLINYSAACLFVVIDSVGDAFGLDLVDRERRSIEAAAAMALRVQASEYVAGARS
jgi:hypothetical protein